MALDQEKDIIDFTNVSKSYSNKRILSELSFNVKEKEFLALMGNNGCGKTTTLKVICNLCSYDQGEVFVFGSKIEKRSNDYKNNIGMVFGTSSLIPELTVSSYIRFVGEFQFLTNETIEVRFKELVELFELQGFEKIVISKLSSGNKMKVAIIAALIHNPELLVLDEPFINLDIKTIEALKNLLKQYKGSRSIILTSHSLDHVVGLSDRFLVMEEGAISFEIVAENSNLNTIKEMITKHLNTKII
jgi:ABC-2 type transport system ATP-binding protein